MQTEILYVPEMARLLGRTEAAIRAAALREVDWLPKPMTGMGRRVCWHKRDVDKFLEDRRAGSSSGVKRTKPAAK